MTDEQWTPWVGMRNAWVGVAWRVAIVLPIMAGLIWLITAPLNTLVEVVGYHWVWLALMGAGGAIPGVVVGQVVSGGLTDRAGFVSFLVLTLPASLTAAGSIITASVVAGLIIPQSGMVMYVIYSMSIFAMLWTIKITLLDT